MKAVNWCSTCNFAAVAAPTRTPRITPTNLEDIMEALSYLDFMRGDTPVVMGHEFCGEVAERGHRPSWAPIGQLPPFDARRNLAARPNYADLQVNSMCRQCGLQQTLTALEGYTVLAAAAAREAGGITVGGRADLTVFTVDPLVENTDELADAPIATTMIGGDVVHRDVTADR